MGIDPKMVSMWTDADLLKEIECQNRIADHHLKKAEDAAREAREIAAQLSMRHPGAKSS